MDHINLFKKVLREDETPIITAKGMAKPYVLKRIGIPFIIFAFFTTLFTILAVALPYRPASEDNFFAEGFPPIVTIIFACVTFGIFLIALILSIIGSKKYYVCLTSKRVIIRSGVFNVSYTNHAIEKVSGNISVRCGKSILDNSDENSCSVACRIELMPVGHGSINIFTASIDKGYEFAKQLETIVAQNAKANSKAKAPKE